MKTAPAKSPDQTEYASCRMVFEFTDKTQAHVTFSSDPELWQNTFPQVHKGSPFGKALVGGRWNKVVEYMFEDNAFIIADDGRMLNVRNVKWVRPAPANPGHY